MPLSTSALAISQGIRVSQEMTGNLSAEYYKKLDELLAEPAANPLTAEQVCDYIRAERDSWE